MTQEKGRIGSSFEGFLEEEGRLEESTAKAVKRLQSSIDEGFASGVSDRSLDEILDDARSRAQKMPKPHGQDEPA